MNGAAEPFILQPLSVGNGPAVKDFFLFLETWSNRNLESKASHAELSSRPGWLVTTRADVLLFYFLDAGAVVAVPAFRLQRWAFGSGEQAGVYAWPEKRQGAHAQRNDTWGRCVPIEVVEREVGARRISLQQI